LSPKYSPNQNYVKITIYPYTSLRKLGSKTSIKFFEEIKKREENICSRSNPTATAADFFQPSPPLIFFQSVLSPAPLKLLEEYPAAELILCSPCSPAEAPSRVPAVGLIPSWIFPALSFSLSPTRRLLHARSLFSRSVPSCGRALHSCFFSLPYFPPVSSLLCAISGRIPWPRVLQRRALLTGAASPARAPSLLDSALNAGHFLLHLPPCRALCSRSSLPCFHGGCSAPPPAAPAPFKRSSMPTPSALGHRAFLPLPAPSPWSRPGSRAAAKLPLPWLTVVCPCCAPFFPVPRWPPCSSSSWWPLIGSRLGRALYSLHAAVA
jgi:hypothetical protein